MIEAVCFEKEHRYLPSETHAGWYTCRNCRDSITPEEFERRSHADTWVDGKAPLNFCDLCQTWHVPQEFDINSLLRVTRLGREIQISDRKNGRFVYETNRGESGYVTAQNWNEAVERIEHVIQRAYERRANECDEIAESLAE